MHLVESGLFLLLRSTPEGARATSEARAQSVVDHLCMCVNRSYLHAEGFGFSQMKNPTDASMNRRVEIRFVQLRNMFGMRSYNALVYHVHDQCDDT